MTQKNDSFGFPIIPKSDEAGKTREASKEFEKEYSNALEPGSTEKNENFLSSSLLNKQRQDHSTREDLNKKSDDEGFNDLITFFLGADFEISDDQIKNILKTLFIISKRF